MKRLKRILINHFNFSPVEVRGFFILMLLLIFFTFLPTIWKLLSPTSSYDSTRDQAILDSLLLTMQNPEIVNPKVNFIKTKEVAEIQLFKFNPNNATETEFIKLGIKPYLAKRIVKYRSKGGKFYQKEDLLKIYGFPEKLYKTLVPYIDIPIRTAIHNVEEHPFDKEGNLSSSNTKSTSNIEEIRTQKFNLNEADTIQLKQVYGIGSKLANRIVKFRDKLGGFHSTDQLQEVYGLKPEVIKALLEKAKLTNSTPYGKIKVNQLDAKALQQHPYISWKEANFIIKYRKQHGPYTSIDDLKEIKVFDDNFIKKIAPYISYEK